MPHLRFKAVSEETVRQLSKDLPADLARIISTTEDNFSFELVQNRFFEGGKETAFYPFVEFAWFDRGQEVQDRVAELITEKLKQITRAEYVAVVFLDLPKNCYYENSKHFGS